MVRLRTDFRQSQNLSDDTLIRTSSNFNVFHVFILLHHTTTLAPRDAKLLPTVLPDSMDGIKISAE